MPPQSSLPPSRPVHRRAFCRLPVVAALLLALVLLPLGASQQAEARVASIVIEAKSGRVLHALNADTRNYPASLTKMMTLYLVFDALEEGSLSLDEKLSVSKRAAGMSPSKLGLQPGKTIRTEDAILSLITKSANDAAVVLAEHIGGTEIEFARLMTAKAATLNMNNTTFRNASGLPNKGQLSSARDMATLSQALFFNHSKYYAYFNTQNFSYGGRKYTNHNRLLKKLSGTDGIKTGYIRASGFNVAASTERNGIRLITVVFGGQTGAQRDYRAVKLTEAAFAKLASEQAEKKLLAEAGTAKESTNAKEAGGVRSALSLVQEARASQVREVVSTESKRKGLWGIQVGAFSSDERAQAALALARNAVAETLATARSVLEPVPGTVGPLQRAQFHGLSKSGAYNTCAALRKTGLDCLILAGTP